MRSTIGFAIAALVLGLFGVAFLGVARLEGHMADAGQSALDASVHVGAGEPDRGRAVRESRAVRAVAGQRRPPGDSRSPGGRSVLATPVRCDPAGRSGARRRRRRDERRAAARRGQFGLSGPPDAVQGQAVDGQGARRDGCRLSHGVEEQHVASGRRVQLRVHHPPARRGGEGKPAAAAAEERGRVRQRRVGSSHAGDQPGGFPDLHSRSNRARRTRRVAKPARLQPRNERADVRSSARLVRYVPVCRTAVPLAAHRTRSVVHGVDLAVRPAPWRSEANPVEACPARARAARRRWRSGVLGSRSARRIAVHRRARTSAGARVNRAEGQRRHRGPAGRVGVDVRLRRTARPLATVGAVSPHVCGDPQLAGRSSRAGALRAARRAAGETDEGSQRALLFHRSSRGSLPVPAREHDDVGHQHRGGHPLGASTGGEGRRGFRKERKSQGLSRDLRRPGVERHRGQLRFRMRVP